MASLDSMVNKLQEVRTELSRLSGVEMETPRALRSNDFSLRQTIVFQNWLAKVLAQIKEHQTNVDFRLAALESAKGKSGR